MDVCHRVVKTYIYGHETIDTVCAEKLRSLDFVSVF
jgi:hypothetical protein